MSGSKNDSKTAVLLISHGSRLAYGKEVINKLAEMYRETTDYKVGIGYMEIAKPDIATAVDDLVKGTDINKIIAVPVFLAHGVHTKRDIPTILGLPVKEDEHKHNKDINHSSSHSHNHSHEVNKVNFDGEIVYTEPLGADDLVLEIIKKRVANSE